jgi:hypothetical protein
VKRLRWARPTVQPLDGSDWRITTPPAADRGCALAAVREWLREQELTGITMLADGTPCRVEPA